MPVVMRLLRNTPGSELQAYFAQRPVEFPEPVDWTGSNGSLVKPVLKAIDALSEVERERIRLEFERADRMTSDVGQTALMDIAGPEQRDIFRDIATRHARIVKAVLSVRFKPDTVNPQGRTITIKLRHPNGCDLKDKTEKERLIGEKYLRRWRVGGSDRLIAKAAISPRAFRFLVQLVEQEPPIATARLLEEEIGPEEQTLTGSALLVRGNPSIRSMWRLLTGKHRLRSNSITLPVLPATSIPKRLCRRCRR